MKKTFFAGLIILLPVALTIMIFVFLIDLFTTPFLDVVRNYIFAYQDRHHYFFSPEVVTVIARLIILILLVLFTFLLGFVARWFFFRTILNITQKILSKIPFIRTIFKVSKDIATALFKTDQGSREAFRETAFVPFPSRKSSCVGFVSGSIPRACDEKIKDLVPVFVPTAPHPISGYLMMARKEDVLKLDMTNEQAVKLTVSCGMILPEDPALEENANT